MEKQENSVKKRVESDGLMIALEKLTKRTVEKMENFQHHRRQLKDAEWVIKYHHHIEGWIKKELLKTIDKLTTETEKNIGYCKLVIGIYEGIQREAEEDELSHE